MRWGLELLGNIVILSVCVLVPRVNAAPRELRILNPTSRVVQSAQIWQGWFLVTSDSDRPDRVTPKIEASGAQVLELLPATAEATAQASALFAIKLQVNGLGTGQVHVTLAEYPQLRADCLLRPAVDLSQVAWEQWWAGAKSSLADARAASEHRPNGSPPSFPSSGRNGA